MLPEGVDPETIKGYPKTFGEFALQALILILIMVLMCHCSRPRRESRNTMQQIKPKVISTQPATHLTSNTETH